MALMGCSVAEPDVFGDIPLRNPTAPLGSQVNVDSVQMHGSWRIVEAAGIQPGTEVEISAQTITLGQMSPQPYTYDPRGRYMLGDAGAIWLYWLDTSGRTAAMGDPDGQRVWIMDRASISPDRRAAARDILEWYGYDLTRLVSE